MGVGRMMQLRESGPQVKRLRPLTSSMGMSKRGTLYARFAKNSIHFIHRANANCTSRPPPQTVLGNYEARRYADATCAPVKPPRRQSTIYLFGLSTSSVDLPQMMSPGCTGHLN